MNLSFLKNLSQFLKTVERRSFLVLHLIPPFVGSHLSPKEGDKPGDEKSLNPCGSCFPKDDPFLGTKPRRVQALVEATEDMKEKVR